MSVWNMKAKWIAAGLLAMTMAGVAGTAQAQRTRPTRRETSANRKARIQRTIEDTYTHRWEVGGGGGYLRWRSGPYLQKNNEVNFWTNATYFLNPKLGITGEIRGAYGKAKIGNTIYNIPNPQISEYTFMAGPTYRVYAKQKSAISLYAQGGTALGKFDGGSKGIPATDIGMWPSSNARAAFSVGANLDYNLFPNLAARVSPTYVGTTFGGTVQNNFGFNLGVVYRFGRIH
ncbi:outer membrane protein [Granulicella arctica]|uniref:Outer membrane protein beta-barrel domain-containing protein n=1 Tax=Granulicella arctica TaxID=940613 RepID=A0A7Y9PET0_9BACT|nr:outer membrane beta-barrel protein [Granulicella arctica]NYF77853.1 hypothetical protein [Granulicella arctica]